MQPLTPEQIQTLLVSGADGRLHALWALLVTSGLRVGEATALNWDDIDLDAHTAVVHQTLHRQRGIGLVLGPPKTDRSRRPVHLAAGTVGALRKHLARQKREALESGRPWSKKDLVFSTEKGGPLDIGYLRQAFHRCLKRANLPLIRIHDLRHTAATYLLSIGTHPKVVQDMLGHSSITLTLDTYSHYVPALHKEAAQQMDHLFRAQEAS
jgi:integrase